jgi:hypothetical protein
MNCLEKYFKKPQEIWEENVNPTKTECMVYTI